MTLDDSLASAAKKGNRSGRGVISVAVLLSITTALNIARASLLRSSELASRHANATSAR
jgi:hypothetical protein